MAGSWNNIVKFCSDYIPGMPRYPSPKGNGNGNDSEVSQGQGTVTIDEARQKQDAALRTLGLYRYKIPEDGNCMFRAVASQMKRDQDKNHPLLREAASNWAAEHIEELLANGLLDSIDEVEQMRQLGTWQGQAALVALANVLGVNIAVVQGGDEGDVDIQHIKPHDKSPHSNIMLAYLYSGHYDAASDRDGLSNPKYDRWKEECRRREEASMRLVKRLTDGKLASNDAYEISEALARRIAGDDSSDSQQDASEQLAWQLLREDAYFQDLHDARPSSPTTASWLCSEDSMNGNNSFTRTVAHMSNQHDSPARCEVDPVTGSTFPGREYSHNRSTPQKVTRRKSPRLADTLLDDNPSVRGSRRSSKDDYVNAVSHRSTVRREVVPSQSRVQPSRQTRGHQSNLDDSHNSVPTVRAFAASKGVTSTLDRARVCSFIKPTATKVNKKKPYESDSDLPSDALSPVRGTHGPIRGTKTVGRAQRQTDGHEVVPSQTQPRQQPTRRCKANGLDRVAMSPLDGPQRLK